MLESHLLEVSKHESYNVVTNCLGHLLAHHCLPKLAKNCQKSQVDFWINYYKGAVRASFHFNLEGGPVLSGLTFLALAPKSLLRLLQNMLQSCLLLNFL